MQRSSIVVDVRDRAQASPAWAEQLQAREMPLVHRTGVERAKTMKEANLLP
jgi:hypothetical protein